MGTVPTTIRCFQFFWYMQYSTYKWTENNHVNNIPVWPSISVCYGRALLLASHWQSSKGIHTVAVYFGVTGAGFCILILPSTGFMWLFLFWGEGYWCWLAPSGIPCSHPDPFHPLVQKVLSSWTLYVLLLSMSSESYYVREVEPGCLWGSSSKSASRIFKGCGE